MSSFVRQAAASIGPNTVRVHGNTGIRLQVAVAPPGGLSQQQIDEMREALRELGLDDCVDVEPASKA